MKSKKKLNIKETQYYKSRTEKIIEALDLPKDLLLGLPNLVFTGNRELFIENYQGIIEYSDTAIRINVGKYILKICGRNLGIKNIAAEEITLCGVIKSLEFC